MKRIALFALVALLSSGVSPAQALIISNGNGQVTTIPVVAPHLLSNNSLIMTQLSGANCYLGRGVGGVAVSINPLQPSNAPMLLELDNRWYVITSGLIQSFMAPGAIEFQAGSWRMCRRANGDPLPASPASPVLTLSGSPSYSIALQPAPFLISYLDGADVISLRSRTGDVVCNGNVPSPIVVTDFKSGFESL